MSEVCVETKRISFFMYQVDSRMINVGNVIWDCT